MRACLLRECSRPVWKGIKRLMFDSLERVLLSSLVIEIIGIPIFLQYKIKLINSEVSPEFEIKIIAKI